MPYTPSQQITADVLRWPGTSVRLGSRGEYALDAYGAELGHLHGDRVAHFFLDRRLGAELHAAGRVGPHPVAPASVKLGARAIRGEDDVADVLAIMRLNYERPIRKVVEALDAASEDAEATAALLTPGATVVNLAGRRVEGADALRAAMTEALASSLADVTTSLELDSVELPAADVAVARVTKRIADGRPDAADAALPSTTGALTITLVRESGTWLVAAMQTTPVLAMPAAHSA